MDTALSPTNSLLLDLCASGDVPDLCYLEALMGASSESDADIFLQQGFHSLQPLHSDLLHRQEQQAAGPSVSGQSFPADGTHTLSSLNARCDPAAGTVQQQQLCRGSSADVVYIAGAAARVDDLVVVEAVGQLQADPPSWLAAQPALAAQQGSHPWDTCLRAQVAAAGHGPSAADQPPASASAAAGVWSTTVSATQGESGTTARQVQLGLASGPGMSVFEAAAQVPVPAAAGAAATVVAPTCVHRSMSSPGMQLQTQDSIQGLEACAPSVVALPVSCLRLPGLPNLATWPGLSAPSTTSAPSVVIKPMKKPYKPQNMQQLEREMSQARERNKQLKAQLAQLQAEVATASARLSTMRQQYEQQQETNKRLRMDMSYAKDMVAALRQRALAAGLCT